MADGDKTEKPTPKRKREARRKGQIPKSQDLTSWLSLLLALYLLPMTVGRLAEAGDAALDRVRDSPQQLDSEIAVGALTEALREGFLAVAPLLGVLTLASVLITMGQTGLLLSFKPIVPDFKRVNPLQGFKRLFSARSAWETGKQVLKIVAVVAIAWPSSVRLFEDLIAPGRLPLLAALSIAGAGVLGIVRTITWTMVIVSLADYGYQRWQTARSMRMTKQEVKDEFRNAEGDQMVKGRIRSLQRTMARNRTLASIADADVVVTNPTHLAVALRYDPASGRAPVVLATGANAIAAKIRERATESEVPIVEAQPLARALWRACDPGDEIPIASYEAVAQVLAFVRRLDRRLTRGRLLELPRTTRLDQEMLGAIPRKRRRLA